MSDIPMMLLDNTTVTAAWRESVDLGTEAGRRRRSTPP